MGKVHIGYKLKNPNGSFHDPILGLTASHDEVIPLQTGRRLSGTNFQRWISHGGLVPVYEDDTQPLPEVKKAAEATPPPATPPPKVRPDYEVMTKTQLLDIARKLGLPASLVRKTRLDIIEILSAQGK